MNKLAIVGASGHGKVIADIAEKNGYTNIIFFDDNYMLNECCGYPVVGKVSDILNIDADIIVGIGDTDIRKKIHQIIPPEKLVKLIHPNAVIARDVTIGNGSVVMAGTVINIGTKIGEGCIINTCSSIDHDCVLGNFVHIAVGSHLCGNVIIDNDTWVGAGSVITNNIKICSNCTIGAGAVVISSIKNSGLYIGVPAKIKEKSNV